MSNWPMRGHFRYLHFKNFPMTSRTPQCEVFWALLSSSEHSGVSKDSKSQRFQVLGFTRTLGQSGVATILVSSFPMYVKLVKLAMVHITGIVEDERCFSTLGFFEVKASQQVQYSSSNCCAHACTTIVHFEKFPLC